MPLVAPELDDRRFDDLMAEVRRRIPRYAPEWTDHNDSDPGIILAKLFAWMTELTLYRVNRIPDRATIKFLELLEITPKPAGPSHTLLVFTPALQTVSEVIVPRGTQVAAAADEAGPILFETEASAVVLGTPLTAVQVFDGIGFSQVTTRAQAAGQWFHPFGPRADEGSALCLGFATQAAFTAQDFALYYRLPESARPPVPFRCGSTGLPAHAGLVWEFRDAAGWQPLALISDGTRSLTQDGSMVLRGPGGRARPVRLGEVAQPLYWLRCRLVSSSYEAPPKLDAVLPNAVAAVQAATVEGEFLGRSDGRPDQRFTLGNLPVVPLRLAREVAAPDGGRVTVESLLLEIDEGDGFQPWQEVPDFLASGPEDPHYTLDRGSGAIVLGDNLRGRIPLVAAGGGVVARRYQYGGGRRGNLPAGSIASMQGFVAGIEAVTNPYAATGGADEEPMADLRRRAAAEIASNGRAVTAQDFETRALATPGARIRRARAVPLLHPNYPGAEVPGAVTLIVVPDAEGPAPMPNQATLAAVCAHLDKVRLLTTEMFVVAPRYRKVRVEVDVEIRPDADPAQVKRALEGRLDAFFHPLTGGMDPLTGEPGTGGWPFGGSIYVSDLFRLVLETPGVLRMADGQMVVRVDGEPGTFCRDTEICPYDLTWSDGHDVRVRMATRVVR
ncbi:putative baseplate assembly protein [Roseomonas marmotae]|uniref:Baseplate assembly protein n=1 Tax=Roseomonas marmotae TaxID=2768161 RepID=A0ABS3KGW8_9PROT|nr:putative baseplate assembly protein [Roseomonas marmotae]MBO1076175.1 putative baseplate assembly protein [Roseomonas marmotae]QTI81789.1 putative baseplate assembly protein [Roseomonas marmotae]